MSADRKFEDILPTPACRCHCPSCMGPRAKHCGGAKCSEDFGPSVSFIEKYKP